MNPKFISLALALALLLGGSAPAQQIHSPGVVADGHTYVDLGLSVKWATCNLGAMSPVGYGKYYAWGETETKALYVIETSKTWRRKYADISGNPEFDAAAAEWGGDWRTPTKDELEELAKKCKWEVQEIEGAMVSVVTGPSGNQIIIPVPGFKWREGLGAAGDTGYYWSSTPYDRYPYDPLHEEAYVMPVRGFWYYPDMTARDRDSGYSVRPVYGARKLTEQPEHTIVDPWEDFPSGEIDGHDYVDLGLSVMWATCNVGAERPNAFGDYFAWGEIRTKTHYELKTYTVDFELKEISGDPKHDAAMANWGGRWRTPTLAQVNELYKKCKYSLTRVNGKMCAKFTAANGNSILIPYSGSIDDTNRSTCPTLWCSESKQGGFVAMSRAFGDESINSVPRDWGLNVRAVAKP